MASLSSFIRPCYNTKKLLRFVETPTPPPPPTHSSRFRVRVSSSSSFSSSDGGGSSSYLDMWKKAMEREREENKILKIVPENNNKDDDEKSIEFLKLLQVPTEERDRIQRIQVIDRAAAAISFASTLLNQSQSSPSSRFEESEQDEEHESISPGPNSFWSWIPPPPSSAPTDTSGISRSTSPLPDQPTPLLELELQPLSLPFETESYNDHSLPPFQSLLEVVPGSTPQFTTEQHDTLFPTNAEAEDAAHALAEVDPETVSSHGTSPQGSMWWKETGTQVTSEGVVYRWTLTRGLSPDKSVEWEEKYWEAADEFGYKELGSEKSGRDASGNVWRELWKESMSQIDGCLHIEKTADKWGKNGKGDEWQEKWFEHYGAGQAEKWAHKWCSIEPTTQLEAGHAHVWHERWGEKYDGQGGSVKYTDKWAERSEGDGWTKWGDKWDEHFDPNGHGVKQGETWWEGKHGERWNKTWGEGHNGSGWVHKYGKSSCGQHWDTHVQQDTWYERFPHYDFYHCYQNSVPLRQVKKPSER